MVIIGYEHMPYYENAWLCIVGPNLSEIAPNTNAPTTVPAMEMDCDASIKP